jgi:2-oxoglutarate dehydrogenase E1 component
LRLQAATLDGDRRPLVVMTPKSLLRHPRAMSSLSDLAEGRFQPVLDGGPEDPSAVRRVILCSGKIAVDLEGAIAEQQASDIALVRVELLYPFPEDEIKEVLARYAKARNVVWLQEEPRNMGAWTYVEPRLSVLLPKRLALSYVGRPERAATAEGSSTVHAREQARILAEALNGEATKQQRGVA